MCSFAGHQSLSMSPCFSTLVLENAICSHFSLQRLVLRLFYRLNLLPFLFSNTLGHIQVSDTSPVPSATPPRPLQVYNRRPHTNTEPSANSSPMAPSSTKSVLQSPADHLIAIRKGIHSSRNPHHIYNFLTYHRLSSPYSAFFSTLSSVSVPQTMYEALSHPDWTQAMVEEIASLHSSDTWD